MKTVVTKKSSCLNTGQASSMISCGQLNFFAEMQ